MVRAWMHLEEYSKALDFLNYIIEETESRLISPGPELVETDSLKGEILFFMYRYQEAERNVQKALSLLSEMKRYNPIFWREMFFSGGSLGESGSGVCPHEAE